jgi:Cof subfamily protein (haloacid dehalogenase superfamily)
VNGIRLLALDVDGTLVRRGDEIGPRTRKALARAHEAGLRVALATGRRWRRARSVARALELPVPVVCLGGALVKEEAGRTVDRQPFAASLLAAVVAAVHQAGASAVAHLEGGDDGPDFVVEHRRAWNPWMSRYVTRNQAWTAWSRDLAADARDDVLVVGAFGPRAELEGAAAALREALAGRVAVTLTPLPPDGGPVGFYLEVQPAHVSKWHGLQRLAAHLGVAEAAVCAVGDERNDLPMLRAAGLGVAMGNAPAEVRAAARLVIGRHDEDAVADLVERLLEAR